MNSLVVLFSVVGTSSVAVVFVVVSLILFYTAQKMETDILHLYNNNKKEQNGKQRRVRADSKIETNRLQRKKHLTAIKINFQVWDEEEKIHLKCKLSLGLLTCRLQHAHIHCTPIYGGLILCDIMSCWYTHIHISTLRSFTISPQVCQYLFRCASLLKYSHTKLY